VDYSIPFELITSIVPHVHDAAAARPTLVLRGGDELQLDSSGDLGERNPGVLIFVNGRGRPDYVEWTNVERVDFGTPAP